MIINCSLDYDYFFIPEYGDLVQFLDVFGEHVYRVRDGWTFKIYQSVPEFTIKGVEYFGVVAQETRSFETKTQLLRSLGLCVTVTNPQFLPARAGIYTPAFKTMQTNALGYRMTGMPQLYAVKPNSSDNERVVIGCTGRYNFESGIFQGLMDFDSLGNVWKE